MEERKACSSSRKPLECLYIWEQLIQSEAVILQQAWKQVVPVTSTRCATECFCVKPPSVQGCIAALPSQTDLHPLGLSGYVLHHLNLEDRRGERVTCEGISALLWTILPFFYPLPKPFPCATIGEVHSLDLLCSFACSWREAHACVELTDRLRRAGCCLALQVLLEND